MGKGPFGILEFGKERREGDDDMPVDLTGIDADLSSIKGRISDIEGDITNLVTSEETLETDIGGFRGTLTDFGADIDSFDLDLKTNRAKIADLETDMTALDANVTAHGERLEDLESQELGLDLRKSNLEWPRFNDEFKANQVKAACTLGITSGTICYGVKKCPDQKEMNKTLFKMAEKAWLLARALYADLSGTQV